MFNLLHLDGYLLYIADRCHIWIACHFQTVTPIPVIFISFSSDFISPFQWLPWISMLSPGSFIHRQIIHMHRIPHPAYHTMFMCGLFTMLCVSFRCLLIRVGSGYVAFGRTRSSMFCLSSSWTRSSSLRDFRQDDHTLEITTIFALLDARSFSMPMLRYLPLACHASYIVEPSL